MSSAMSVGGLVSGLQTDNILSQLEQVSRAPITRMKTQQAQLQSKALAWSGINTSLLGVKEQAKALADLRNKVTFAAVSSDATVGVTTGSGVVAGNYTVKVNSISSYDQYTSTSTYADADTTKFTGGKLTLKVGDTTREIDSTGLTLNGLRDAINGSGANVSATIISDGAATPRYRLLLTSKTIGTAGAMTIGGDLAGWGSGDLVQMVKADDTRLTFGSGANTFEVTRTGTSLTDVIAGVTLTLSQASVGKTVDINVSSSTAGVEKTVRSFVSAYNSLLQTVAEKTSYNAETGATGQLFGENQLQQITGDLYARLSDPVSNLSPSMNSVVQLGLKMDSNGTLTIDDNALKDGLTNHLEDVYRLFESSGVASDGHVRYAASTPDTKTSSAAGYAVHVDAPGRQAKLRLGTELPAMLAGDEVLTVNGKSIALTSGMTADQVRDTINLSTADTGVTASLTGADGTGTGNYLTLTRTAYGAAFHIAVVSTVEAGAGGTGIGTSERGESAPGTGNTGVIGSDDYVGTINGVAATGLGNRLTATSGDAKGLSVTVNASAAGDYGSVVFTRGVGTLIDDLLGFITDPTTGVITSATKAVDEQVAALDETITSTDETVTREMQRMRNQFNAMEVALSKLQNQSAALASQIAQLPSYSSSPSN